VGAEDVNFLQKQKEIMRKEREGERRLVKGESQRQDDGRSASNYVMRFRMNVGGCVSNLNPNRRFGEFQL
jgi:hypothetical protein